MKFTLQGSDEMISIIFSALGSGALLGALMAGSVKKLSFPGLVGGSAMVLNGLALVFAGLSFSAVTMFIFLVLSGIFGSVSAVVFFSLVQTRAEPETRGRVFALYSLAIVGMYPISYGVAGFASDLVGPKFVTIGGALLLVLAGLIGLLHKQLRETSLPTEDS